MVTNELAVVVVVESRNQSIYDVNPSDQMKNYQQG